jgi:hypothetical protein
MLALNTCNGQYQTFTFMSLFTLKIKAYEKITHRSNQKVKMKSKKLKQTKNILK